MTSRVVFIPGIMGSVLVDDKLNSNLKTAQSVCRRNLDYFLDSAFGFFDDFIIAAHPCGWHHNPAVVWGEYGMLHWFFDTDEWVDRMCYGNGVDQPWISSEGHQYGLSVTTKKNWGLPKIEVTTREIKAEIFRIDPYGDFLKSLEKIDLLVFPYDWRLSIAYNATLLAKSIRRRWPRGFDGANEKLTIIAHSMGGLIARFYIEADNANLDYISKEHQKVQLAGHRFVKQLITVGTPHLGAPEAYLNFIGASTPFGEASALLEFLREQLYFPRLFDAAVEVERQLLERIKILTPEHPQISKDPPADSGVPLKKYQVLEILQQFSSLVEMFPAYEFMPKEQRDNNGALRLLDLEKDPRKIYSRYVKWETPQKHYEKDLILESKYFSARSKERFAPWKIFAEFRKKLLAPECLDQWLMSKRVNYHFIGTRQRITPTGYDPKSNKIVTDSFGGDRVVPLKSAILYPWSDHKPHHIFPHVFDDTAVHNELFRSSDIQDVCKDIVRDPEWFRRHYQQIRRVPQVDRVSVNELDDVQGLVQKILYETSDKTVSATSRLVISVIKIKFDNPKNEGVFPYFDPITGRFSLPQQEYVPMEAAGPAADWTIEYTHNRQTLGKLHFFGIRARGIAFQEIKLGGVVFLPETKCQDYLEILTWNLGKLQQKCHPEDTNCSHAEYQFYSWFKKKFFVWFNEQKKRLKWETKIKGISIQNRGSARYSPCQECVADLVAIGGKKLLDGNRKNTIGEISWGEAYDNIFGGGITVRKHLGWLENAGWQIDENSKRLIKL